MFKDLLATDTNKSSVQFFRYIFVGGSAAIVDLSMFWVFFEIVGLNYIFAAAIAFGIALGWNHLLCLLWIFESKHQRWKEVSLVVLIAIC